MIEITLKLPKIVKYAYKKIKKYARKNLYIKLLKNMQMQQVSNDTQCYLLKQHVSHLPI